LGKKYGIKCDVIWNRLGDILKTIENLMGTTWEYQKALNNLDLSF
jgi:hypothetical protein